jgi:hypothetical protein
MFVTIAAGSMLIVGAPAIAGQTTVTEGGARGMCSDGSFWRLRLVAGEEKIGVGYRVNSEVAGELWKVGIVQNRRVIFLGRRITNADGDFGVRLATRNTKGLDVFRAAARNTVTGEICRGRAAI